MTGNHTAAAALAGAPAGSLHSHDRGPPVTGEPAGHCLWGSHSERTRSMALENMFYQTLDFS